MCAGKILAGGCYCGRYEYLITVPKESDETLEIVWTTDNHHHATMGSPFSGFLRVPLDWYSTATRAYYPSETHWSIRSRFVFPSNAQKIFCGYCGTPISYWAEGEGDTIMVSLGSLERDTIQELEEAGLFPTEKAEEIKSIAGAGEHMNIAGDTGKVAAAAAAEGTSSAPAANKAIEAVAREFRGVPWFETLLEGSILGQLYKDARLAEKQPAARSATTTTTVEWDIIEFADGDESEPEPDADVRTGALFVLA